MEYKNGNKNQWRRWTWNRIAERVGSRRDSTVLFLAGEKALDVKTAVLRGFSERQMIAVEHDKETLKKLRSNGILAIDGDLSSVMKVWPPSRPVGVVVGDFCCGLNQEIVDSIIDSSAHYGAFHDCVFVFNFLRGRDKSSETVRALYGQGSKHRGKIAFKKYIMGMVLENADRNLDSSEAQVIFEKLIDLCQVDFSSYKSTAGNQWFDSVVFKSPYARLLGTQETPGYQGADPRLLSQRRRVSAVLAHQTMRTS